MTGSPGRWRRWRCGGAGAQFRTGFRSSVTCVIPPDQQFTLESLGTVKVAEAAKAGERVKTDLVMKYGAADYQIEAAGAEHESTIRTPGSTLSVRGTTVRVTDRDGFDPTAESFTGRALFKTGRGTAAAVGRKGGGYAKVSARDGSAAQTGLAQTVIDPNTAAARTASEARLIARQTSRGAFLSFDNLSNIPVITGVPGRYRTPSSSPACRGRWISFSAGPATRTSTSSCPTSRSRQPTLPRAGTLPRRSLKWARRAYRMRTSARSAYSARQRASSRPSYFTRASASIPLPAAGSFPTTTEAAPMGGWKLPTGSTARPKASSWSPLSFNRGRRPITKSMHSSVASR